ncbi:4964_t:CDS:2 [Entrophospora sp. SA101]|nr:9139_t:CDS:2 [Entrophospora sp. SA101]CAJ0833509.1 4964_t:CDS:2 [Entrophospora sp. SA101]
MNNQYESWIKQPIERKTEELENLVAQQVNTYSQKAKEVAYNKPKDYYNNQPTIYRGLFWIAVVVVAIYLYYQQNNLTIQPLEDNTEISELRNQVNHYQKLYQTRVEKDLNQQEYSGMLNQKITDLENSLLNLAKQKIKGKKDAEQLLKHQLTQLKTYQSEQAKFQQELTKQQQVMTELNQTLFAQGEEIKQLHQEKETFAQHKQELNQQLAQIQQEIKEKDQQLLSKNQTYQENIKQLEAQIKLLHGNPDRVPALKQQIVALQASSQSTIIRLETKIKKLTKKFDTTLLEQTNKETELYRV